jgi:hypothetical protein
VSDPDLALHLPDKQRAPLTAVCQWLTPADSFVAPPLLDDEPALVELLILWRDSFGTGDAVQLVVPLYRRQGTPDEAVAAIVAAADLAGVDLSALADVVVSSVPGDTPEDVAGVAGARASWIALRDPAPPGSGWLSLPPRTEALRAAHSASPPISLITADASHNTCFDSDGEA